MAPLLITSPFPPQIAVHHLSLSQANVATTLCLFIEVVYNWGAAALWDIILLKVP